MQTKSKPVLGERHVQLGFVSMIQGKCFGTQPNGDQFCFGASFGELRASCRQFFLEN